MNDILGIKKEAHKGLVQIRDVMKCDIGKDQKEYKADLSQVLHTCELLDEKELNLYKQLMPQKDQKEKEYLANQVANGLRMIVYSDKVDIEQNIDFNKAGLEKLHRMTDKQRALIEKQGNAYTNQ